MMIGKMLKKIRMYVSSTRNPVQTARAMGVEVGENTRFISMPSFGSEPYLISIGDHVTIASQVAFVPHDGATWCFRNEERYKNVLRCAPIKVGNNCFIGFRSTILCGVNIGDNSIVGACSLVTKDIPSNEVWGGVPAHFICTLDEYKEKCLRNTPPYDPESMKKDKKAELLRIYKENKE